MQVAIMQTAQANAHRASTATLSASLSATLSAGLSAELSAESSAELSANLDELCGSRALFPMQMSPEEREALAIAAISGHAEAEFMVGCVFDACDQSNRAMEWYFRSARHKYLPAMLQLFALR